jgi:isoleucyl-tRNA synthetase
VIAESKDAYYILSKERFEKRYREIIGGPSSIEPFVYHSEFKGSDLVGLGYTPPFPEYYHGKHGEKNHKIYHADFITDTDGTGIGHEAPEFGDVDFQLAKREGIHISNAMDEAGKYTSEIHDME